VLYINPGSAGPPRFQLPVTVGTPPIEDAYKVEFVNPRNPEPERALTDSRTFDIDEHQIPARVDALGVWYTTPPGVILQELTSGALSGYRGFLSRFTNSTL